MTERHNAPRRYFVDAQGKRVLIGLSPEETAQFEALDMRSGETVQIVAEIGPGTGQATTALTARGAHVVAVEPGAERPPQ